MHYPPFVLPPGRSPLGLRGLKYFAVWSVCLIVLSQPSWAAWIEICKSPLKLPCFVSQPSWAAWIEITRLLYSVSVKLSRSPLGLRGLKCFLKFVTMKKLWSQPSWAAWIEIYYTDEEVYKQ